MKSRHLLPIPCLLIACALALAACGGDAGGDNADAAGSSEPVPKPIEKAVTTAVVNPQYDVDELKITRVRIEGDEATAETELTGGTLDGQSVAVVLVKDKKRWKVKELARFTGLDKPLLVKRFEEANKALPEKLTAAQVRCLTDQFQDASQETVEAMLLDHAKAAFLELGKPCKNA